MFASKINPILHLDKCEIINLRIFRSKPRLYSMHQTQYENSSEYNIDDEDETWLNAYNKGYVKLPSALFEKMIRNLELIYNKERNGEKLEAIMSVQLKESMKHSIMNLLIPYTCLNISEFTSMHCYWLEKRTKMKNSLIRSLQAPTPFGDRDSSKVFRSRVITRRPVTRRRKKIQSTQAKRENDRERIRYEENIIENIKHRESLRKELTFLEIKILLGILTMKRNVDKKNRKYEEVIRLGFTLIIKKMTNIKTIINIERS